MSSRIFGPQSLVIIMDNITIDSLTDNRPLIFLTHLKLQAKTLVPDYPWDKDDAFEWLWALTSSLEGTRLANDDWIKLLVAMVDECLKVLSTRYSDANCHFCGATITGRIDAHSEQCLIRRQEKIRSIIKDK